MNRTLYNLLLLLALPLIFVRLGWRALRQPAYLRHVGERFGWYDARPTQRPVWIHAVSVGEARAAQPLVQALQANDPALTILMTYMTPTGRETGIGLFGDAVTHAYLPYDYGATVARFLDHFQPRVGLIMETELWPNLLAACQVRRMPACLINARLSEKSALGYQRAAALAAETLGSLTVISAQSEADAARLKALGARGVQVCGNLKFDVPIDLASVALGMTWRDALGGQRLVLAATSTREGEEKLLLDAWLAGPAEQRARTLLVIVPRHPQRFAEVAELISRSGLKLARRSDPDIGIRDAEAWLGDSMGEMAAYYALCDVAIIGGSLLPFGAQNLIEACTMGKPVVLGPSTFNFAEAAQQAMQCGAALQAADAAGVLRCALQLLEDPALRAQAGAAGQAFGAAHRGATQRNLALIAPLLKAP